MENLGLNKTPQREINLSDPHVYTLQVYCAEPLGKILGPRSKIGKNIQLLVIFWDFLHILHTLFDICQLFYYCCL